VRLLTLASGSAPSATRQSVSIAHRACERWRAIADATRSASVSARLTSASAHARSDATASKPTKPMSWPSWASGTSKQERIPCAVIRSRSLLASSGRSSTRGIGTASNRERRSNAHGNAELGSALPASMCGVTPGAHHSWPLSMVARSVEARKT
jgi:hypothetical protein